jgi:endonuclease/exonuclease/phosphatase family metal-dependent hydrolase
MRLPILLLFACAYLGCTSPGSGVRIATYNVALNRPTAGALRAELEAGSPKARAIAAVIAHVDPDVILLQELDRDPDARAAITFRDRYLEPAAPGAAGYPHVFTGPSNTGEPSGHDLDGDGAIGGPGDAFGYGTHTGQYGMALLSRFPIVEGGIRTFRLLRWQDMPGHRMPEGFLDASAHAAMRLSSKSHWDVPVILPDGRILHVLASHPTPPVFDGPEDRNGRRNHDEIRFWADYLTPERATWIVDDQGRRGGLAPDAAFVLLGDLNCDPHDGDALDAPIALLLGHARIQGEILPASEGAAAASAAQGGVNATHRGPARADTGDFDDTRGPGNLRLDYVLPSRGLGVLQAAVFWPLPGQPGAEASAASDHRAVYVDIR